MNSRFQFSRTCGLIMGCFILTNAYGREPLQWYQLSSRTGVYLKVDLEPKDRQRGADWNFIDWFHDYDVKGVYLDDKPLDPVERSSRISVFTANQAEGYEPRILLGTGTRSIDFSKYNVVPEHPGVNVYRFASAQLCTPLEAPFCFRMGYCGVYNLPVNGPGWEMNDKADFSAEMAAAAVWCEKRNGFLQNGDYSGLANFQKAFPMPLETFPTSLPLLSADKTQVCFGAKQVSDHEAVFSVRNQTFGRYIFISYDSGCTYKKADAYLQPVAEDADSVLLDLDKLPASLGTRGDVKAIRVLVAGTRKWSVHAKVYVWGQGWEKEETPAAPPSKPPVVVPVKPTRKGKGTPGMGMVVAKPKEDPKPVANPDCW